MAEKCSISDFLYNSAPGPPSFSIYFEHTIHDGVVVFVGSLALSIRSSMLFLLNTHA